MKVIQLSYDHLSIRVKAALGLPCKLSKGQRYSDLHEVERFMDCSRTCADEMKKESFPMLEMLDIRKCDELMDIPDSFGDIASLKLIHVLSSPQLKNSTFNIKEYVEEMTGEDKLGVCFQYRWS
ncbi:hypothetical protein H5410_029499 [Solanum commersonii]|uniref:Uncharacterized protein n=1 Tax=Solanum commersonii TaxID=4109 RepID=A0A9J5Z7W9_SOLCO|nr:hypothetical protein H5410_029499 [Solanum commersonii]